MSASPIRDRVEQLRTQLMSRRGVRGEGSYPMFPMGGGIASGGIKVFGQTGVGGVQDIIAKAQARLQDARTRIQQRTPTGGLGLRSTSRTGITGGPGKTPPGIRSSPPPVQTQTPKVPTQTSRIKTY